MTLSAPLATARATSSADTELAAALELLELEVARELELEVPPELELPEPPGTHWL
jgi:hypothetical protein